MLDRNTPPSRQAPGIYPALWLIICPSCGLPLGTILGLVLGYVFGSLAYGRGTIEAAGVVIVGGVVGALLGLLGGVVAGIAVCCRKGPPRRLPSHRTGPADRLRSP